MVTYRLLYDSILDFKGAAVLVESEIRCHDVRYDSDDTVEGMNGRKHHDTWVSMKAVSHFNLGTALELLLKLLLVRTRGTAPRHHELAKLYDTLSEMDRKQLESKYRTARRESTSFALLMFNKPGTEPPPETRNINRLRCQRRPEYGPGRRRNNVPVARWQLVHVVHGRDPRAGRRAFQLGNRRPARGRFPWTHVGKRGRKRDYWEGCRRRDRLCLSR